MKTQSWACELSSLDTFILLFVLLKWKTTYEPLPKQSLNI